MDVFRIKYKEIDGQTKDDIFIFKNIAENLLHELEAVNLRESTDKRCMAIAKTKLEETIMWAVKSIT
jgi:hypothetical protein